MTGVLRRITSLAEEARPAGQTLAFERFLAEALDTARHDLTLVTPVSRPANATSVNTRHTCQFCNDVIDDAACYDVTPAPLVSARRSRPLSETWLMGNSEPACLLARGRDTGSEFPRPHLR